MKLFFLTSIVLYCSLNTISAQTSNLGSWNILHVKYKLGDQLSLFGEGQLRSLKFYDNFHYHEFKGGVNLKVHKNMNLTLGAGSYQTYKEGGDFLLPKNNNEFRLWPQIVLNQSVGQLKIEQRYRAELRWTSNGYRNRFRYRVGVFYAFGTEQDDINPFKLALVMNFFLRTKSHTLKEIECQSHSTISLLKRQLYNLVIYISSTTKLMMKQDVPFFKLVTS